MDAPVELDTSHVRLGDRPLIVCDVDDVVLHFFAPFLVFLDGEGHEFLPRSFRLTGNVISKSSGAALEEKEVHRLIGAFFEAQELSARRPSIASSIPSAPSPEMPTSSSSPPCRRNSGLNAAAFSTGWVSPIRCSPRCSRRGRSCRHCTASARCPSPSSMIWRIICIRFATTSQAAFSSI